MPHFTPSQTRHYIQDLMRRYNLGARKAIGQHYIIDDAILARVVAACELTSRTTVVEVGAGIGNLTTRLAEAAGRVVAIELDRSFQELHDKMAAAYSNLSFAYCDALDFDWESAPSGGAGDLVIAGNIPYQISSPLVMRLLRSPLDWRAIVFMTQREVAERLCADPGPKSYGALSLKTKLVCEREILFEVSAKSFFPPPRVESAVIRLTRRAAPLLPDHAARLRFFTLADALFQRRRKQAPNSLAEAGAFGLSREQWAALLRQCGIEPTRRGETLSLGEALALLTHAAPGGG